MTTDEIPVARPVSPEPDAPVDSGGADPSPPNIDPLDAMRRRHTIFLAIALMVGFLMPVNTGHGSGRLVFPNISLLAQIRMLPPIAIVVCVFPAVAGVAMGVTAIAGAALTRAVITCSLGAGYVMFLAGRAGNAIRLGGIPGFQTRIGGTFSSSVLGVVGAICILIGFRVLFYRPKRMVGALVAAVGAGMMGISLFVPVARFRGILGAKPVPLVVPFRLLRNSNPALQWIGKVELLRLGLVAACVLLAILSLACASAHAPEAQRRRGRLGSRLLVASVVVPPLLQAMFLLSPAKGMGGGGLPILVLQLLKIFLWIGCSALVLPFGVIDLATELTAPEPGDAEPAPPFSARLRELQDKLDEGLISQEEFDRQHQQLIDEL